MKGKRVFRIISSEIFLIPCIVVVMLFLSFTPEFVRIAQTPIGREYIPVHNSLSDYPFYSSVVAQGVDGQWLVFDRFATKEHSGTMLHYLYLLVGQLGRSVGIGDPHLAYFLGRVILSFLWCIVVYLFIAEVVHTKFQRILAYFLCLYSASWPILSWSRGRLTITGYMGWWSELDPIMRATFVPHFLAGHIFLVLTVMSLLSLRRSFDSSTPGESKPAPGVSWALAVIFGWVAGFVHPPSLMILLYVVPLWALLLRSWKFFVFSASALAFSVTSLVLLRFLTSTFPWNLPKDFEALSFAISIPEYLLALGPIVVLGIIGFVGRISDRNVWLLGLWAFGSIVLVATQMSMQASPMAFIRMVALSNIRYFQVVPWVPLGILGAIGVEVIGRWAGSEMGRWWKAGIVGIIVVVTFVGYPNSIKEQINHRYGHIEEMTYAPVGWMNAIRTLRSLVKPGEAILSMPLTGQIVPGYINRTVFVGQDVYTPEWNRKVDVAWAFYKGTLAECEAFRLVKDNNIRAVVFSFDEQKAGDAVRKMPFLQPWNSYDGTEIYNVVDVKPAEC